MTFELLNEVILSTVQQSTCRAVRSSSLYCLSIKLSRLPSLEHQLYYLTVAVAVTIVIFIQLNHCNFRFTETVK